MLQIIDYLEHTLIIKSKDIIYIDKEKIEFDFINDYKKLYKACSSYKYIFVDEIQNIDKREKAILALQNEGKDVYITGSNSNLLSSNLATNLRGRYIQIQIFPLDYSEFLLFHKLNNSKDSFEKYIMFGWLPYLCNLPLRQEIVYEYLKSIWETIILKDIVERFSIRNVTIFNSLLQYIANNLGNIFSSTNITKFLKSQKITLSSTTILWYLQYLQVALALNECPRYDIKWKKIFEIRQKYFFTDIGIRNAIVGWFKQLDISGILENIIFITLTSNGWNVKVWEIANKEVDFVCEKNWELIYIQVAYLLESSETKEREFSPLMIIQDNRTKYVLSMDEKASGSRDGIRWMNIWDWALEICKKD